MPNESKMTKSLPRSKTLGSADRQALGDVVRQPESKTTEKKFDHRKYYFQGRDIEVMTNAQILRTLRTLMREAVVFNPDVKIKETL